MFCHAIPSFDIQTGNSGLPFIVELEQGIEHSPNCLEWETGMKLATSRLHDTHASTTNILRDSHFMSYLMRIMISCLNQLVMIILTQSTSHLLLPKKKIIKFFVENRILISVKFRSRSLWPLRKE